MHVASALANALANVFHLLLVGLLFDLVVQVNHVELLSLRNYARSHLL